MSGKSPEQTTDRRWNVDQILDRLYDRKTTPAWLLVALEDIRQQIAVQKAMHD